MKPHGGRIAEAVLWLLYPLLIFGGLQVLEPRQVACMLALLLLLRQRRAAGTLLSGLSRGSRLLVAALALLIALAALGNSATLLKLYPATISLGMLLLFGLSLRHPPPMIERFARLKTPDLSPRGVAYTRRVTQVWCAFFAVNGSIALATALWASTAVWTFYNGLASYVLMGLLMGAEMLVRRRVMAADAADAGGTA